MAGDTTDTITLGGIVTGIVALPYIAYQVWQKVKSDNKGDDLDVRVQSFTTQLQAALDKVVARCDSLQTSRDELATENAHLKARIEILEAENLQLRAQPSQAVSKS